MTPTGYKRYPVAAGQPSASGWPQFETLDRLDYPDDWFEVYDLGKGVFAIHEGRHLQKVISYLILGKNKALLLDTGLGVRNIRQVVNNLTDLPLELVNSHSHYDHVGDNWRFPAAYIYNHPAALKALAEGLSQERTKQLLLSDDLAVKFPAEFDLDTFYIQPCNPVPIEEGHLFDLGGRTLQVYYTPGHSADSIMLADDANQILFTGDTLYPGKLYAYLSGELGSNIPVYIQTLRKMHTRFGSYTLHCSHCEPVRPGKFLAQAADGLEQVQTGQMAYTLEPSGVRRYVFDGFSILTQNAD